MTRLIALLVVLTCFAAGAGAEIARHQATNELWGIAPKGAVAPAPAALHDVHVSGINALVLDLQHVGPSKSAGRRVDAMRRAARVSGMSLVVLVPEQRPDSPALARLLQLCGAGSAVRCATLAPSVPAAKRLAKTADRTQSLVAVRVSKPSMLDQLASLQSVRRPILVVAPLYRTVDSALWDRVLADAAASPAVELAVAPVASVGSSSVQTFGVELAAARASSGDAQHAPKPCSSKSNARCADVTAPSAPAVSLVGVTASTATVSWLPSVDDVGVAAYRTYVGGSMLDTAATSPATVGGLTCGVPVAVAVAAVDAAGNVSPWSSVTATPGPCVAQAPAPGDTEPPSTPAGVTAAGVGQTDVTLTWNASVDNVGVSGYRLFRDGSQVGTASSRSYVFGGLACGTTYTLGVAAVDAAGNASGTATTAVATTACPDTTAPSTPAGLVTSAVGQTSATLSWNASSDDVGVTGYRLFRGASAVGTTSGTSYAFGRLACGTTYTLGVAAVDAAGNVSATATTSLTTAGCGGGDVTPPSAPTGLVTSAIGQASATLSWRAASDDVGVTGYRLFRGASAVGTTSGTSYAFGGLACGTAYTLGVAAVDAAGNVSGTATTIASTAACPDTTAPSTPTGLATNAVGQTSATLSWNASSDDVGVTGYRLFRGGSPVGTSSGRSYVFGGLTCGTAYALGVAAVDAAGNVSGTASRSVTTAACSDTSAPSTPAGLATSAVGPTSATLSWNGSSDNVGVTGYRLFRGGSQVATSTATSYLFSGLACGTSYTVGVAAFDAAGNVSTTASMSVRTSACPSDSTPPSTPTGLALSSVAETSIGLSWTASTDNVAVTGYRLFQGGTQAATSVTPGYLFGGLACGTTYTLGVAAVDAAGNASATASVTAATSACSGAGAGGADVYVAQSAAGAADGSTCASSRSAAFFNTAANWGAGKTFAPGVTVGLCGPISSTLTVQGSGVSGSPITLSFQPGAKLEQPVCDPCLDLDNRSFVVVDGNGTGQVDSSANGSRLAKHASSTAITADPCTNCEIKDLTIGPVYQVAAGDSYICASGCAVDNAGAKCVRFSGANWKIDGNTLHDASWCLYEYGDGQESNTQIYGNDIYNIDHGWIVTGGGPYGHLYFHHNHVHDMGVWDACDSGANCHHDGIHCFFGPGSGTSFADSYIYDNVFDGTVGTNATAWIYLESNAGSPCANSSSKWWIFNNVFSSSDQVSTNPYVTVATGTVPNTAYLYNNTFAGLGSGHYGANASACSDTSADFENNAVGGCAQFNGAGSGVTDYNAYAFQSAATNCWPASGGTCDFATWQATGHDTHGAFSKTGAVGSNAAGVGTNLTRLCTGGLVPLCSDLDGNARPTSGSWGAGAYG